MPGAKRKAPNATAGHRNTSPIKLVPRSDPPPPAPRGLLKPTRDDWELFWRSSVASQVDREADLPVLRRLFVMRDELDRSERAYRRNPLIEGSMGQMVLNPAGKKVDTLRGQLTALEDRFGLTPLARARLGWTLAEGATAGAKLQAFLNMTDEESPEEDDAIEGAFEPL